MPKEIPPIFFPYGLKYNPSASYAFHAGYIEHSTEDCGVFKTGVQELIDHKILYFSKEGPNIRTNPFPNQNESVVNTGINE